MKNHVASCWYNILSVQQKALAEGRIPEHNVDHLITFDVIDYCTFARNQKKYGKFDRVLSCEMIEAVGHGHLGEFFGSLNKYYNHMVY